MSIKGALMAGVAAVVIIVVLKKVSPTTAQSLGL